MGYLDTDSVLKKVHPNEPIFVLRARDITAPAIVRVWCALAAQSGTNRDKIDEALKWADVMIEWQRLHGCKSPD